MKSTSVKDSKIKVYLFIPSRLLLELQQAQLQSATEKLL